MEELIRLAGTVGLDLNHLRCDVRGQHDGPYGYQKISAPSVLEMLAGRTTASELNTAHGWRMISEQGTGVVNPFERHLEQGRMFTQVRVEAAEDESDDWLNIEFGDPDPAVSPFVVQRKSNS